MTTSTNDRTPAGGSVGHRTEPVPASVWWVATVLATGAVMAGLDTSLVNVGLDTVGRLLGASLSTSQWISSGYLLALAAALPVCGWASRQIGAGRLWLWALLGFTVTSALCGLAVNIEMLVLMRVLQGIAGGLLIPAGMSILGQVAGRARMGRVMAVSSVPAILAPAFGPVVGALLIAEVSWRWLFLVNIPVGLLGLLLGLRWVPRGDAGNAGRLDLLGLGLVVAGLPALVFGLTQVTEQGSVTALSAWLPAVAGLAALVLFAARSLRIAEPLMDLRLVRNRVFAAASAEVFFAAAALFGGLIVMPLYFQHQMREDIVSTGLLLMAFSVAAAATFPVAGWANDRYGGGVVTAIGLVVTLVGTVPMALLPPEPDIVLVEVLQVVRGIGLALAGSPGVAVALASVRREQMSDASAQVNILSRVGGGIGSALFVALLAAAMPAGASHAAVTEAFHQVFWWLSATALVALAAACWLMREQTLASQRNN